MHIYRLKSLSVLTTRIVNGTNAIDGTQKLMHNTSCTGFMQLKDLYMVQ
jgi:hypothetical protein